MPRSVEPLRPPSSRSGYISILQATRLACSTPAPELLSLSAGANLITLVTSRSASISCRQPRLALGSGLYPLLTMAAPQSFWSSLVAFSYPRLSPAPRNSQARKEAPYQLRKTRARSGLGGQDYLLASARSRPFGTRLSMPSPHTRLSTSGPAGQSSSSDQGLRRSTRSRASKFCPTLAPRRFGEP